MATLTKASHVGRYDTTARTCPYERIFTMALFILIRYIFHSCHLVSSIYLYLFSTYSSILHACLFTSVPSEASLFPPSFPSCRLDSLATSLAQSKPNWTFDIDSLPPPLPPQKCLKPRQNPQKSPRRPRKHTPLTSNLSCPNSLLYPFHIQTHPSSISIPEPVVGTSFV